jgi:hypothetical protein
MPRSFVVLTAFSAVAALGGCFAGDEGEESGTSAAELSSVPCPDVSGTNIARSLAVTDPAALAKFSFTRVMNQIRTTASVASTETTAGVYQRWMRTFGATAGSGDCNDPNIDPNKYGLVCPRPNELELAGVNPFASTSAVKFVPVALFNRLDLAPTNGANCGEYRIVYAMTSSSATLGGRAFIIFEAALPNPDPAAGVDACLPVARFWQGLTADADAASRAAKLERFYLTGGAVAGFAPVVRAAHYGLSTNAAAPTAGQVRTNFFVDFRQWHLREFKLNRRCNDVANPETCQLAFGHVPVKANPAEELFAGTHARSEAFRTAFANQVAGLAAGSVTRIRMSTSNVFNELESVSQRDDVRYATVANAAIRSDIQAKLTALGSTLTPTNVLERATTQTCAGCHQVSNNAALGGGRTWPSSLGFVHVDESGQLSPALTGTFLPARKAGLEKFINDRCSGTTTTDAGPATASAGNETVGGSAAEAAN